MRILTINYEYPPVGGGGGVAHKKLVDEWRKNHEVTLVTSRFQNEKFEQGSNLTIHRCFCFRTKRFSANMLSLLWFPIATFPVLWRLRKEQWDVINTQFAVPSGIAGVVAKLLIHKPHVLSIHGGDIYDPSKSTSPHKFGILRAAVRWVFKHSDLVISQSKNTLENARKYYGFEGRCDVIPLPYAFHEIPDLKKNDTFTYISIGRLIGRKAFHDLITAFARVHKDHPETRLEIIGDGPLRDPLDQQIRALGLEDVVDLTGYVTDEEKFKRLKAAHCYVLSSLHEGYGIVLQEAMECGLPVVATNHGGQTDFLTQDENAELVSPSQPSQLAAAMSALYASKDNQRKYVAGHEAFLKSLDSSIIASAYEEHFQQLAPQPSQEKIPHVSIIIVNWNAEKILPDCFDALAKQTYANIDIIFVDNGSQDRSVEIAKGYDRVHIVQLDRNYGFAGGNNAGWEYMKSHFNSSFAVLLNNDTEVKEDWLEQLVACAQRHPNAGSISPKVLFHEPSDHLHSTGILLYPDFTTTNRGMYTKDTGQYEKEEEIFGAIGCSVLVRVNAVEGDLFIGRYFAYREDDELAWRLRFAGYTSVYCPSSELWHKHSFTAKPTSPFKLFYTERNRLFNLIQFAPAWYIPVSLWHSLTRYLKWANDTRSEAGAPQPSAGKGELILTLIKAYVHAVKGLPYMLRKRWSLPKSGMKRREVLQLLKRYGTRNL